MNKTVRLSIGLLISAFCLWFVFKGFDFHVLKNILGDATYRWFLPPFVLYLISMTCRAIRWRIVLSPLKKIPLPLVLPTLIIGFMMNNILPARGGEIVRSVTLAKKTGLTSSSVIGSVVAERLMDMLGLLMTIAFASRLLPWDKLPIKGIALAVVVGFVISGVFVVYAQRLRKKAINASTLHGKILRLFTELTSGFLALQSPLKVAAVVLLSMFIWTNEILMPFFISRALHLNLSFFESAALLTGLSVGVMIPAAPGYVGTYEFFGKSILAMLGKPPGISLGFVLVLHFFHTMMTIILGVPSIFLTQSKEELNEGPHGN